MAKKTSSGLYQMARTMNDIDPPGQWQPLEDLEERKEQSARQDAIEAEDLVMILWFG